MNRTTDPENGDETPTRRRRRWVLPAVLTVTATAAVGALAVTAYPGAAAPATPAVAARSTATPTAPAAGTSAHANAAPAPQQAKATPAPPVPPGVALDKANAQASLHSFLGAIATVDSLPQVDTLTTVAGGAILDELANEHQELDSNGWTQHGQSVITALTVLTSTTTTATIQACIDSSAVTLLDNAGKPIGTPDTNRRALNIYTLTRTPTNTWQVTNRTFPDNPTC